MEVVFSIKPYKNMQMLETLILLPNTKWANFYIKGIQFSYSTFSPFIFFFLQEYTSVDGSPLPRCNSESYYMSNSAHRVRCPADMVVNPMNIARIEKNVELRKASEYTEAVQVKPQHVYLKLRISKCL